MTHYFEGTGEDLEVDVDGLLEDVDRLDRQAATSANAASESAVRQAQALGIKGPVTFPLNTPWSSLAVEPPDSENWFYAVGSIDHNLTGTVTVFPPEKPGGSWRYETETVVNLRDRYNWDTGKGVQIDGKATMDTQMQRFHHTGHAQEYNMVGQSSVRRSTGHVP